MTVCFSRVVCCASSLRTLRSSRFSAFAFFLLFSAGVLTLHGQSPEIENRSWDLSMWVSGATGEEITNSFSEARIFAAGVFVGRQLTPEIGRGWRRGSFEFGADFVPIFTQFTPQRISGTAFDPIVLRWNSSTHLGTITPFMELGGGGVHTTANFPPGDTSTFNFIARAGGGVLISAHGAQTLEISCRWWHISNANLGPQNPEFNGIQFGLGWHWFK